MMTNFSRILNEMTSYQADKNQIIQNLVDYPLLIIDDLGIERNSEFALEQVYNVIDSRYCKMLPLIVTTNLGLNEMKSTDLDTAHQRIYSRILEMCVGIYSALWIRFKMKMKIFKSIPLDKVLAMENDLYYYVRKSKGIWK